MYKSMKKAPKLFISYSWSSPEFENWVLNIATELRENGVDVVLDKWDLKEGNESTSFMEQMVNSPDINKVLIISDKNYMEKANVRFGGVGIEAQIISKEIYERTNQSKFVVAITEKDENNKPYIPTYYTSRMYIDFCDPSEYHTGFEKLLRWIFDKPLYKKPELGNAPQFLNDNDKISLGTTFLKRRVENAFREKKEYAYGCFNEYLTVFSSNLEKFRIKYENEKQYTSDFLDSINAFLLYREEFLQLCNIIFMYDFSKSTIKPLHNFFESLISYRNKPDNIESRTEKDFDNYKFIIHELFLHFITLCIKFDKFSYINDFLNEEYYNLKENIIDYTKFNQYIATVHKLKENYFSPIGTLLQERIRNYDTLKFHEIMQTDFILYIRSYLMNISSLQNYNHFNDVWCPDTNIFADNYYSCYPIFKKSQSIKYFENFKQVLGIESKTELVDLLNRFKSGEIEEIRWKFRSLKSSVLIGIDNISTK